MTTTRWKGRDQPHGPAIDSRAKPAAHARISIIRRRIVNGEGLDGGAGWIRTPGTARFSMDGVGRGFGALFGPTKSIRAGENLFAWDSAAKLAFVRLLSPSPVRG